MATCQCPSYIYPIIKPVGSRCNLKCSYCYYRDRQLGVSLMSDAVLENLIKKLLEYNKDFAPFLWHGGEPLLAGIDFYKRVIALQEKYRQPGHRIKNFIQTNAVLINQEWVDFFKKHDFGVGTSLDGPRDIHEHFRPNSFDQIMEAKQLMWESHVGLGMICVVNSYNVDFPEEVYHFLRESKFSTASIKPCIEMATHGQGIDDVSVDPLHYGEFMVKLFDLWVKDNDPRFMIREFENIMLGLLGAKPILCTNRFDGCLRYVTVNYDGFVYSCDSFVGSSYQEYVYGNVQDSDFYAMIVSEGAQKMIELQKRSLESCSHCQYLMICGGGCGNFRIHLSKEFWNKYCLARRMMIEKVAEFIRHHQQQGG